MSLNFPARLPNVQFKQQLHNVQKRAEGHQDGDDHARCIYGHLEPVRNLRNPRAHGARGAAQLSNRSGPCNHRKDVRVHQPHLVRHTEPTGNETISHLMSPEINNRCLFSVPAIIFPIDWPRTGLLGRGRGRWGDHEDDPDHEQVPEADQHQPQGHGQVKESPPGQPEAQGAAQDQHGNGQGLKLGRDQ